MQAFTASKGYQTLFDDGIQRALEGRTTIEESLVPFIKKQCYGYQIDRLQVPQTAANNPAKRSWNMEIRSGPAKVNGEQRMIFPTVCHASRNRRQLA